MSRLIAYRDQEALSELRLGAVVLDRRGEVWQVLLVRYAEQPTRGWFRLGDTGNIYGAGVVSEQGPLRVLYDRGTDLPENVEPCSYCNGSTNDPDSEAAAPVLCPACGGAGWFLLTPINEISSIDDASARTPIALAQALDQFDRIAPSPAVQGLLPPLSLEPGMTVRAEPKAAHVASQVPAKGIVIGVREEDGEVVVELDVFAPPVGMVRLHFLERMFSFRPVEDA